MLTYTLAVARPSGMVPPRVLETLRDPPELPFRRSDHMFRANPSGSVAFATWQDTVGALTAANWLGGSEVTIPWARP
jgi:hypothetical protein